VIQLREDIAWVRDDAGTLTPFDNSRLAASIHLAAAEAGQADMLLAESVAAAVYLFARDCQPQHIIAAGEVARIVVSILTALGCADMARAYARRRSQTEIRLDELAVGADAVFELDFYRRLDAALRAASGDALVQLRGLRSCVKRLRGAQRWGAGCRALAEDIVGFVRDHSRRHVSRPLTIVE
jgi:hypothetical protein